MARDPSRWWYLLVPFPVLVGARYLLAWLTGLLLPTAGPTPTEALPVLFLGLGASLVGALVVATAPLFAAGVILDVRALRTRSSWTPHWGYGTLGLLPVLGVVVEWVALVSIPATIGYLELRRRRIGYPLGRRRSTDGDTTLATVQSSIQPPSSLWWYGVLVPPVVELTGRFVFWAVRTAALLRQGSDPLTLLVPVALTLLAVGLIPLFAVSLYRNAKGEGGSPAAGEPTLDPRVWGVLGLGSVVGLLIVRTTFMPIVALAYVLRHRVANSP